MRIRVVSDALVPSFRAVAERIVDVFRGLGHEVDYKDYWGYPYRTEAFDDCPDNVLFFGLANHTNITFCGAFQDKNLVAYLVAEGPPVLDEFSLETAERFKIVVPSHFVKAMLESCNLKVDGVVYHGIYMDKNDFNEGYYNMLRNKLAGKKILFTNASNNVRKGLDKLLVAMKLIERRHKDVFLILHSRYQRKIGGTGLSMGDVDLRGIGQMLQIKNAWVTDQYGSMPLEYLNAFYRLSEFYVCSSLSEGFGFPIIESFRFDTPVVALDAPPMNEIIKDGKTGKFFKWDPRLTQLHPYQHRMRFQLKHYDVSDLADSIEFMLDVKWRSLMRKNIKKEKSRWEARETYKRLLDYF